MLVWPLRNWDETIESTEKNQDHGKNAIKESRYRYFKSGDVGYFEAVIDVAAIKSRFEAVAPFLDERGRRLVAAREALAAGRGGVKAGCARRPRWLGAPSAAGWPSCAAARTISAAEFAGPAADARRRSTGTPDCWKRLASSSRPAIRGDPQAALLWVSKSQRHLAGALAERGFVVQP